MEYREAAALNQAIRLIGIRHRARAAAMLAALGLYPGQEIIMLELDAHGPRTQAQLAAGAGCEPPSVTLMARKLESAGLIARTPSPLDGRAIVVDLTPKGRALIPALKEVWQRLAEETVAGLTVTTVPRLIRALTDLAHSLRSAAAHPLAR